MPAPVGAAAFDLYGAAHLGALGVTLFLAVGLVRHVRAHPEWAGLIAKVLAFSLLVLYPGHVLVLWKAGHLNRENAFPCHLCDIAAILGAVALLTRNQRVAELVWFWGMAGTLNGLLTPALSESFPSYAFFAFFALHSGVVIAAVFLVAGLKLQPAPGAVWRAFGWIHVYFLAAGTVNLLSGANYGFLRAKPRKPVPSTSSVPGHGILWVWKWWACCSFSCFICHSAAGRSRSLLHENSILRIPGRFGILAQRFTNADPFADSLLLHCSASVRTRHRHQ